jgi:hypothetical protein
VKVKLYKILILPVVLYGCESLSLTLFGGGYRVVVVVVVVGLWFWL